MGTRASPLSALDAAFLYAESERTPMHVGAVCFFERGPLVDARGNLKMALIRRQVESRLASVPMFRRRVHFPPARLGRPYWVDDREFSIARHVHHARLPAGTSPEEAVDRCMEIFRPPLDRSKALWELWFVDGFSEERIALVEKIHHAVADGVSGAELAKVLLDSDRKGTHPPVCPWVPAPPPSPLAWALRRSMDRVGGTLGLARGTVSAASHPRAVVRATRATATALADLFDPTRFVQPLPFNVPIGPDRRLLVVERSFDGIVAASRASRTTINEIALTAVCGGIEAYVHHRDPSAGPRTVNVVVPVSLHRAASVFDIGNAVSAMLVRLPVAGSVAGDRAATPDAAEIGVALRKVAAAARQPKERGHSHAVSSLETLMEFLPDAGLRSFASLIHRQPFGNLVVTNVPGPPFPLYAMGSRLEEVIPIVPLAGNLGVGIAIFTYNGRITFGINYDPISVPDADVIAHGLGDTLDALAVLGTSSEHLAGAPRIQGGRP